MSAYASRWVAVRLRRAVSWSSSCSGLAGLAVAAVVSGALSTPARADRGATKFDSPNPDGVARTIAVGGATLDDSNPFFQSLGSNGRSCVSCHVPTTDWSITPAEVRQRFERTNGLDPIFRPVDGATSPNDDVSTLAARRKAYSMLLNRGVIRVGIGIPDNAEFELVHVDDPYGYASAKELSLFRRPLPATNLPFLTTVMWDGRESSAVTGTTPIRDNASPADNEKALLADLMHQANGATTGHAQGQPLSPQDQEEIAAFEASTFTAQRIDRGAGLLNARGALGGPEALADQPFYVSINDVLGGDVQHPGQFNPAAMTLFDVWSKSHNPEQASIARGEAIFNSTRINVTGVAGFNDVVGAPSIRTSCTACHDTPNVGNHSLAAPLDIGLTDPDRRTPDMPLYTLRNKATGQLRQTTDPGVALITGKWADIGKFKGPILRGLASRPPYFHNGSAADLRAVVDFYDSRFNIGFSEQEKQDLVAFLKSL